MPARARSAIEAGGLNMARVLFWMLIVTVAFAPLPLASDRPGPEGLLAILVGAQLVLFALGTLFSRDLVKVPLRRYYWALLGFALLVGWFLVQQSSATPAAWHDAIWRDGGKILGVDLHGTMALDPQSARETILRMITYAGVFFLSMQLCRPRERANTAVWSAVFIGLGYSLYGLYIYFHGNADVLWFTKYAYRSSLTSTFVNRNNFGTFVGMALIAALGVLFVQLENSLRYGLFNRAGFIHFMDTVNFKTFVLTGFAVVLASTLLLTSSRGASIGTAVGVVTLVIADRLARRQTTGAGQIRISLIAIAVFGALIFVLNGSNLIGRINDSATENTREIVYSTVLHAITQHPWVGTGLGSFSEAFSRVRDARLDSSDYIFDLAHNTYLELAFEIGLPAMALLLAILAGIVLTIARGVFVRRRDATFAAIGLGVTALAALHSTVDFSLQMPGVTLYFAMILGLAFAQSYPTHEHQAVPGVRQSVRA
jgi:O-antigen ligase